MLIFCELSLGPGSYMYMYKSYKTHDQECFSIQIEQTNYNNYLIKVLSLCLFHKLPAAKDISIGKHTRKMKTENMHFFQNIFVNRNHKHLS